MGNGNYYTGSERTEILVNKLKDVQVREVAFFATTSHIDEKDKKQRLLDYANAGHILANHSHSHQYIRQLGTAGYIADISKAHQVLKTMPNFKPWFRYPFLDEGRSLSSRDSIRSALTQMGT